MFCYQHLTTWYWVLSWGSGKESTCRCRRCRFDSWMGRYPGVENGNPLQYSCLGNRMDRGAWWLTVHRVTQTQTRPSDWVRTAWGILGQDEKHRWKSHVGCPCSHKSLCETVYPGPFDIFRCVWEELYSWKKKSSLLLSRIKGRG